MPKSSSVCRKEVRQSPGAGRDCAENPSPSYTLRASCFTFARWRQLWEGALGSLNERSLNIQAFLYSSLSNSSIPPNHNHRHTPTWVELGVSEPVPEGPASGASAWPGPLPGLPPRTSPGCWERGQGRRRVVPLEVKTSGCSLQLPYSWLSLPR